MHLCHAFCGHPRQRRTAPSTSSAHAPAAACSQLYSSPSCMFAMPCMFAHSHPVQGPDKRAGAGPHSCQGRGCSSVVCVSANWRPCGVAVGMLQPPKCVLGPGLQNSYSGTPPSSHVCWLVREVGPPPAFQSPAHTPAVRQPAPSHADTARPTAPLPPASAAASYVAPEWSAAQGKQMQHIRDGACTGRSQCQLCVELGPAMRSNLPRAR